MMLYSHPLDARNSESAAYLSALKCSLASLKANLRHTTPVDLYLFMKKEFIPNPVPEWLSGHGIIFVPLDEKLWEYPGYLRPTDRNWSGGFSKEYRLMGHWRLAFQHSFCRALGYEYLFQFDSDTYVFSNVTYNLVDFMRTGDYWITNKNFFFYEVVDYFRGLPELANFWLVTRRGGGCGHWDLRVTGPLWNKTSPQGLPGLITPIHCDKAGGQTIPHGQPWEGYAGKCIAGNYNIWSLKFWFQEDVQDFVHLVLRTGAHIEHRWVDVTTMSIIIDMFVPPEKFHIFTDHNIGHGRGDHTKTCNGLLPPTTRSRAARQRTAAGSAP
eukprot:CAMPEP_0202893478 /NCGR_PEP_ID=MMETSP1392-20130828/3054_1 /ASSEMBLY_ACC=CAM_ASM_000868 /TAXON_ID=225041 /ORGANISM="Chlamydomonas chlamydogama, Strain SAG 11-48b" /LENGTH=325 /DNA_ID=CAMNT_0049577827 /DNA_START=372 /DNA_END=1349 /DNA_ORIENTATION=+